MRKMGHMFLWIGFLVAAFLSVQLGDRVDWLFYGIALASGIFGVVLLQMSAREASQQTEQLQANIETLERMLNSLMDKISGMAETRETIDVYDVHQKIDDELLPDLDSFVQARESMIQVYGLQSYAEVMTRFAGSERMLNRAWSASADGYIDEVWRCIEIAKTQMSSAREVFAGLKQSKAA